MPTLISKKSLKRNNMESPLFGPLKPEHKFHWFSRALVGFLVVAIIFGLSFLFNLFNSSKEWQEISLTLQGLDQISQIDKVAAGGDVRIEPVDSPKPEFPVLVGELSAPEDFSAASIIVKDAKTGAGLFAKNEYEARAVASLTKLMSVLVLLEKPVNWDKTAPVVGEDALDTHIYAGESYTVEELWYAALVGSSNKAILSLVTTSDYTMEDFVARMNQKARELGMTETSFVDPTGLGDGNQASASDLAILLSNALAEDKIREALLTPEYTLYFADKKHHMWNTNWLLLGWIQNDFAAIMGGKTGYTLAAGYSFAVRVENERGKMLDVVVLGAPEHEARFTEARDAAEMVFAAYQWPTKNDDSH